MDDVFIQDTTTDTMLQTLTQYHTILEKEILKAAPDKSFFFLYSVKLLGHQIQNNHIHPFKSKIDGFLKLQPPKNKKRNSKLCWISHIHFKIYIQPTSRSPTFLHPTQRYNRFQMDYTEIQQTFDRVKKELTDETLRLAIPNSEKNLIQFVRCL